MKASSRFYIFALSFYLFCLSIVTAAQPAYAFDPSRIAQSNTGVVYLTTESSATPTPSPSLVTTTTTQTPDTTSGPVLTGQNVNVPITAPRGFATDIGNVINFVLRVVIVLAVLLVFFYLVWGGIQWITSGGEKGKTEAARNKITSAVIGLLILAGSYAILTLVIHFLGFTDLNSVINDVGTINNPVVSPEATPSSPLRNLNSQ